MRVLIEPKGPAAAAAKDILAHEQFSGVQPMESICTKKIIF